MREQVWIHLQDSSAGLSHAVMMSICEMLVVKPLTIPAVVPI